MSFRFSERPFLKAEEDSKYLSLTSIFIHIGICTLYTLTHIYTHIPQNTHIHRNTYDILEILKKN